MAHETPVGFHTTTTPAGRRWVRLRSLRLTSSRTSWEVRYANPEEMTIQNEVPQHMLNIPYNWRFLWENPL